MTYAPVAYQPSAYAVVLDPLDWWLEVRRAGIVAVFAALLGSAVGPIWHSVAPQVGIVAAAGGSSAATKALLGDDMWLGLLGIIAGVVCVLVLLAAAPQAFDGPGAQVGLVIGGVLGMLIAARVGHLIGRQDLTKVIRADYPQSGQRGVVLLLGYFDFKVRATAVLLAWPVTSVFLGTLITWVRAINRPTPVADATYPVFP